MTKEQAKMVRNRTVQQTLDFSGNLSRLCAVPDLPKRELAAPTTILFEWFAELSEKGKVTVRLDMHMTFDVDAVYGSWNVVGVVVTNDFTSSHMDRITATELKNRSGRAFDAFVSFMVEQLDTLKEHPKLNELAYVIFDPVYRLGAQDEKDRKTRKAGSVSELGVAGIIARKTSKGLFDDLF